MKNRKLDLDWKNLEVVRKYNREYSKEYRLLHRKETIAKIGYCKICHRELTDKNSRLNTGSLCTIHYREINKLAWNKNSRKYLDNDNLYARQREVKLHFGEFIYIDNKPTYTNICQICFTEQFTEYHHWNDSHPECGLWLCRKCHFKVNVIDRYFSYNRDFIDNYLELRAKYEN